MLKTYKKNCFQAVRDLMPGATEDRIMSERRGQLQIGRTLRFKARTIAPERADRTCLNFARSEVASFRSSTTLSSWSS